MTPINEIAFYRNEVISEEFDYTVLTEDEALQPEARPEEARYRKVAGTITSFIAGGLLLFGPFGLSTPNDDAAAQARDMVVVRVQNPGEIAHVGIPDGHQKAALRFQQLFHAVPLNDVEKKAEDPDYGL
jgi:hypothetical protein